MNTPGGKSVFIGLIFEFLNPGAVAPGLVGAISLLVALYALAFVPINYAGAALLLRGIALMSRRPISHLWRARHRRRRRFCRRSAIEPHLAEETNGGALIFRAELAEIEQNRLSYAESDPTKGPLIPEVVPEGRRIGGLAELRRVLFSLKRRQRNTSNAA